MPSVALRPLRLLATVRRRPALTGRAMRRGILSTSIRWRRCIVRGSILPGGYGVGMPQPKAALGLRHRRRDSSLNGGGVAKVCQKRSDAPCRFSGTVHTILAVNNCHHCRPANQGSGGQMTTGRRRGRLLARVDCLNVVRRHR